MALHDMALSSYSVSNSNNGSDACTLLPGSSYSYNRH